VKLAINSEAKRDLSVRSSTSRKPIKVVLQVPGKQHSLFSFLLNNHAKRFENNLHGLTVSLFFVSEFIAFKSKIM
jgi:hypothetical protein